MNQLELARWQGAIDERTKVIERRMDSLNGDVRTIMNDIADIKTAVGVSAEFRASWSGTLQQLKETTLVTKAMHDQRGKWLEGWRVRLLAVGGAVTALGAVANFVLKAIPS